MTDHIAFEENGLDLDGLVTELPTPVRSEGSHVVRFHVELLLEVSGQVTLGDLLQLDDWS